MCPTYPTTAALPGGASTRNVFGVAHPVDTAVTRLTRWLRARELPSPSLGVLGELRRRAADETLAAFEQGRSELRPGLSRGDPAARAALGELAERALGDMRERVRCSAVSRDWRTRFTSDLHAWWLDTDEQEYLDDDKLDRGMRVRLLAHLDQLNLVLENYAAFFAEMLPLFRPAGTTRVLDLAAGHGGFALEAARIAKRDRLAVEIAASDIKREYLELGEPAAQSEGLPVRFVLQDALDLGNIEPGQYDVVTCTQSLHHFSPGMAAIMLSEALKAATRGVLFVDGCRSVLSGAAVSGLCLLRWGDPAFAHDAMVSFRRFYAPEELGLLARLGPLGHDVEARFLPPGHVMVRVRKD
jgi:2-polyprenyl-3-methyl-5-hydroxy-6-metoxy-1,4-benzoquinol methylase